MTRLSQRERLTNLFTKNKNRWIKLPVILRLYIGQYNRVIRDMRIGGMIIENKVYWEKGIKKSIFMYTGDM